MQRTGAALLIALAAAAALAHSCAGKRSPAETTGAYAGDAGRESLPDAGDAGSTSTDAAPDAGCASDDACGTSRWCEKSSGICRDAKPCPQGQGNCDYQGFGADYCAGRACYCDPADQSCKPLHPFCSPCAATPQCGNDRSLDYAADCVPADAGFAGASACIPRRDSYLGCPPGYATPASDAYCIPGGGHCGGQGACTRDDDCDPHSPTPNCNAQLGLCVAACSFDLKTGASPACPEGQVCHLTPRLAMLQPQDSNYGKGRCGPPCTSATACGSGLACRSEGIDHPVQRCGLPPPECLGDVECADSPATGSYAYCDLATHACKSGCRTNADCHPGRLCSGSTCVAETCLQAGGADNACDYGQFCCGETDSPAPCPAGTDAGACYDKPAQTWCGACSKDDDCNGGAYPSRSGNKNICLDDGNGHKTCALGCDLGRPAECPRSWQCQDIYAGCQNDGDCGSQAGAHCDLPADGGSGLCGCSADGNCPSGTNCRSQKCVFSSVCRTACP